MDNPYARALGGIDPIEAMTEAPRRMEVVAARLRGEGWARSYAPGKWTAQEIVGHLMHAELIFPARIRYAITTRDYVVQPFEQDDWVAREPAGDPAAAVAAFCALRRWNLALFRSLSPDDRARRFHHPERGAQTVGLILEIHAGHDRHHLAQLEAIAAAAGC